MSSGFGHSGELTTLLADVTARVLEEAAFVITRPASGDLAQTQELRQTSIAFVGPKSGLLRLSASKALLSQLTADMLGVDADAPATVAHEHAALDELAHMVAGALVAHLPGGADLCRLDLPRSDMVTFFAASEQGCAVTLRDMEGNPLRVELLLRESKS